jgi:hypothetical protein
MPYNVYLFNGLAISNPMSRTVLSPANSTLIQTVLKGYFDQVVQAHDNLGRRGQTSYGSSNVLWVQPPFPNIAAHELLIYLIPAGTTVVTNGKLQQGQPPSGHDGFTHSIANPPGVGGSTTGSEVFPNFALTPAGLKLVASIMFHETMHNKLALNNAQLHPQDGLAMGPPPPSRVITDTTPLTTGNINTMAQNLDVARPQWTAGLAMLDAAAKVPDSDPMKGNW